MPKIELYRNALDYYIGERLEHDALEEQLTVAKGEIDEWEDEDGIVKIELNDTNRPDLWSTAGLGRQLFIYRGGRRPDYAFFSTPDSPADSGERVIQVDPALETRRPYVVGFIASGKEIDEATLADMIQTQEKLCWNYGQKRRAIAMGIYRSDLISFPVHYQAADPDATRFVPLGEDQSEQSLRQIIEHHPKGQEFGHIVADFDRMPYLVDSAGETLSFPPVINSAKAGAVETGDSRVFIEMTGTDQRLIMLAASIVACDLADGGFTIEPVRTEYPYDTPFGRSVVSPLYFQKPLQVDVEFVSGWLGLEFTPRTASAALARMGVTAEPQGETGLTVYPPAYRNDYLHQVDVAEDIMVGHGMDRFEPEPLHDFTVGRLSRVEEFSREVKSILVGLGYQEFVFNYLGSRRDYRERMTPQPLAAAGAGGQSGGGGQTPGAGVEGRGTGQAPGGGQSGGAGQVPGAGVEDRDPGQASAVGVEGRDPGQAGDPGQNPAGIDTSDMVRIANPMSENYEFVRPSVLPSLMAVEAGSANAVYPHLSFEVGKVAVRDDRDVTGTRTDDVLGLVASDADVSFNTVRDQLHVLLYFLNVEYELKESDDQRFLRGRRADVVVAGETVGVIGEIHPQVLENWGVEMPCAACELNIGALAHR